MKVGILTLYSARNCGAYLQAYAMQEVLRSFGLTVEFIELGNVLSKWEFYLKCFQKRPERTLINFQSARLFRKDWRHLNIARGGGKYDVVIVGSDEVWNALNPTFKHRTEYFGNNINADKLLAYAPSCGESTYEDLKDNHHFINGIKNFSCIFPRDENTREIVANIIQSPLEIVCDPTLLYDWTCLKTAEVNRGNFILYYGYNDDPNLIKNARRFAWKNNLALVSACFYNDWCDYSIPMSPLEFVNLVEKSSCVLTTTFHGTLFSILKKKQFGLLPGADKSRKIITQFGLDNNALFTPDTNFDEFEYKLMNRINYGPVNSRLQEFKEHSLNLLKSAIGI